MAADEISDYETRLASWSRVGPAYTYRNNKIRR